MNCNSSGRLLIESFETFESLVYQDQNGVWTQGYGHTNGITADSPPCTLEQANAWLAGDLAWAEAVVTRRVHVPLTENQFSALCCLVFNIGSGNFQESSALGFLNAGQYDKVPAAMALWNRAGGKVSAGLVRRRTAEGLLWAAS